MNYIRSHWRGDLALWLTLCVNFIALLLVVTVIEVKFLSSLKTTPETLIKATIASLVLTKIVLFIWQIVGLLRAAEVDFKTSGNAFRMHLIQGLIVISMFWTLSYAIERLQVAYITKKDAQTIKQIDAREYAFSIEINNQSVLISGEFEVGLTQATKAILKSNPQVTTVELNSQGGNISEGRGLGHLFAAKGLSTQVLQECSSACTTAFIGGVTRTLGQYSKLGFHQYKVQDNGFRQSIPFYDMQAQQQRDLDWFQSQGISESFLKKLFHKPPNKIWYPDHQLLLEAGILHRISDQITN